MEPDQVDLLASAMLRNFQKVEHAKETRRARELRSDIGKTYRLDRIDFNLTLIHSVSCADFDMRAHPYANTAGDFSLSNSVAQAFCKKHKNTELSPESSALRGLDASTRGFTRTRRSGRALHKKVVMAPRWR